MADKKPVKWTLWVYAGPGAFAARAVEGQVLPLAEVVGKLPDGVAVLAETVGAPTLLQQFTGEWPTRRHAIGLAVDVPRAERDLGSFLAWADAQTPAGSRRALIVLGDLLQAIGEAPKNAVAGGYRPPYPPTIGIKRKSGSTTATQQENWDKGTAPGITQYTYQGVSKTVEQLLNGMAEADQITFGAHPYQKLAAADQYFDITNTTRTPVVIEDDHNQSLIIVNGKPYPGVIRTWQRTSAGWGPDIAWSLVRAGGCLYNQSGSTTRATIQELDAQGAVCYDPSATSPIYYARAGSSTIDHTAYNSDKSPVTNPAGATRHANIDLGGVAYSIYDESYRSLDDVGPADVDPVIRRIDALVSAIDGHHIDVLASDGGELSRLAALRRLGAMATVLVEAQPFAADDGAPLVTLLAALRGGTDSEPEQLARRAVEKSGQGSRIVALRASGAVSLVAALDAFARQALTDDISPAMRCFEDAWDGGQAGDLTRLTRRLKPIDSEQATRICNCAVATVLAPPVNPDAASFGIELDGQGLQLGASTDWTRLLDKVVGYTDLDVLRNTLGDLQSLAAIARRSRRLTKLSASPDLPVIEFAGPDLTYGDSTPARSFKQFLELKLDNKARHVALVVRGKWAPARPGSVSFDDGASLSIATLARHLREALGRRGRGPLALIVFEDPELLRIENAYELRDVAYVLLTAVPGAPLPAGELLTRRMFDVLPRCEQRAADALHSGAAGSVASMVHMWRQDVAVRLAKLLVAPEQGETAPVALQGIELRPIEALCHLFNRLCDRMFDHLDDPAVLTAVHAGDGAHGLLEWINKVQMEGFWPLTHQGKASQTACDLHNAWGDLYNWISQSTAAVRQGASPLWIAPNFTENRDPAGPCARLRVSVGPRQPADYRALSFHQNVSLHALLTAARLLGKGGAQKQWGLISMGLAFGPTSQRREQLKQLVQEPNAAHYFDARGAPPLLGLSIDREQGDSGYALRLVSSESQAALLDRHTIVDHAAVDRSFAALTYVMSRSMASREGFAYLEGLGADLSEDIVNELREQLERERSRILKTGRSSEAHLALELPRELMHYPWELLQLPAPGAEGGLVMLAERFAVGRQMWTDRGVKRPHRDEAIRMLIVAAPETQLGGSLQAARQEGEAIQRACDEMNDAVKLAFKFECDASIGETMTRAVLRQRLRTGNYDVLHFAGHGKYDADDPDHSGWLLSDGFLTVTELCNTLAACESPPWLIYANACNIGMIGDSTPSHGDVHGMADACIRAGVSAFIAPMWRIEDESARMLASEFYRLLLLERSTVGVALQHARMKVRKAWEALRGDTELGDISWAGMVLFGNPGARLRESAD